MHGLPVRWGFGLQPLDSIQDAVPCVGTGQVALLVEELICPLGCLDLYR